MICDFEILLCTLDLKLFISASFLFSHLYINTLVSELSICPEILNFSRTLLISGTQTCIQVQVSLLALCALDSDHYLGSHRYQLPCYV